MKKIKIKAIDFYGESLNKNNFINYFGITNVKDKYDFVYDEDNPDYLIIGPDFKTYMDSKYENCIKIFLPGEMYDPDFSIFDYAIGNSIINYGDRYLHVPLVYRNDYYFKLDELKNRNKHIEKTPREKFCSYLVTEPIPIQESPRDLFFQELCKYKKVDSGGKHLNNIGGPFSERYSSNWKETKKEWLKQYKFNICFENASFDGYLTEKLFQAYEAGCIPIYWGDPTLTVTAKNKNRFFINPKSYINIQDFNSFNEAIEFIKKIDNNNELYFKILNEPIFLENINPLEYYNKKVTDFMDNIFKQDKIKAKRTNAPVMRFYRNYLNNLKENFQTSECKKISALINKKILYNISENKKATQSSIAPWCNETDKEKSATRALKGQLLGGIVSFFTDVEDNPWWMVDLEKEEFIYYISIQNRIKELKERAKTIKVELSVDGINWVLVPKKYLKWDNLDFLNVELFNNFKARYIKLSLDERNILHLAKIEVFALDKDFYKIIENINTNAKYKENQQIKKQVIETFKLQNEIIKKLSQFSN